MNGQKPRAEKKTGSWRLGGQDVIGEISFGFCVLVLIRAKQYGGTMEQSSIKAMISVLLQAKR